MSLTVQYPGQTTSFPRGKVYIIWSPPGIARGPYNNRRMDVFRIEELRSLHHPGNALGKLQWAPAGYRTVHDNNIHFEFRKILSGIARL